MTYQTWLSRLWAFLALLAMLGSVGEAQASDRLRVVASFSILADMAQEIGGDRVLVTALVGANADAHSFEPSPQQGAVIAKAQLVIANGLGFEPGLTGSSPRRERALLLFSQAPGLSLALRSPEIRHHHLIRTPGKTSLLQESMQKTSLKL